MAPRSDGSEPSPPPLISSTFRSTFQPSDLVLYGGDLLDALGGSSLQRILSFLSARLGLSSRRQNLLRQWMFGGHRVWGFVPVRVSIDYPPVGIDYSKLFFLESPYHTRIACRFDLSVVCSVGLKDPNLLLFWTLVAVVALVTLWILVKLRDVCVCCYCCCSCFCCNVASVFFLFCFAALCVGCFAALCIGCFAASNVTLSVLYVGFCIPLCRAM